MRQTLGKAWLAALSLAALSSLATNALAKPPALLLDAAPLIGVTSSEDSGWRSLYVRLENADAQPLRGVIEVESRPAWTKSSADLTTNVPFSLAPHGRASVEIPTHGFGGSSPSIRVVARDEKGNVLGEVPVTAARPVDAAVLDLGTPNRVGTLLRNMTFASRRGIPYAGRVRVASVGVSSASQDATTGDPILPELPAGYGTTTLVLGMGRDLSRLSGAELAALADWVLAGGALALGVDRPEDLRHPLLVALAGGQLHEARAPAELAEATTFIVPPEEPEQPSPSGGTPFRTQRLAPSAELARRFTGYAGGNLHATPFGVAASYGLGELHLLAFSPRDPQALADRWVRHKLTDLVRHAYDREPQAAVRHGAASPNEVSVDGVRRELDPNQTSRWTIVVSALILLTYAGLAGPLSFYLAARKGRPLRALWQLPIWSTATLLIVVTLGVASKGIAGRGRRLALVDAGAGMTRAAALRFRGFYAPSSRELTVRAGQRDHVLDVAGTNAGIDIRRRLVLDGDGPRLQGLRTKPWQTVLVREEGYADLGGGVSVIALEDDFLIKNRAARDLLGVVVRSPSGAARYFRRIKDGESVRASSGSLIGSLGAPSPMAGTAAVPLDTTRFAPTIERDFPGLGGAWTALEPALGTETEWWPADVPVVLFALDGGEGRMTDSGVKVDYDRVLVRVVGQGGTP